MKSVLVIIFSAVIIIGSIPNAGLYLWFNMDHTQIVENHCVQRKKKTNTCQGKCYLKKKIKENKNQTPLQKLPTEQNEDRVYLYVEDIKNITLLSNIVYSSKLQPNGASKHNNRHHTLRLLRPPQV